MPERWLSVTFPIFCDHYEVNDHGQVRRRTTIQRYKRGHVRRLGITKGYYTVSLSRSPYRKTFYVHDLVAAAFLGPKPAGLQVNHIDGNPRNNRVTNLEYVTRSANMLHWARTMGNKIGETHHGAILTEKEVLAIRRRYKRGVVTYSLLGDEFGVNRMTIYDIVKRRTWTHI